MKHKLLSILLTIVVGLGYSVECNAQNFYLKTKNGDYISCSSDGTLSKGATKQAWNVSFDGIKAYVSTTVSSKTLYLKLDENQIKKEGTGSSIKITSKFIGSPTKTEIYLFDGSKGGTPVDLKTSVADGESRYLVSPKITVSTNDYCGYYIFRHDYNTSTPIDAKLMKIGSSGSDSYRIFTDPITSDTQINISTNSSANDNTRLIFEAVPTVQYAQVKLGSYDTNMGTASISGVTLNEAFNSGTATSNATKTLTLTATPKKGYSLKGWQLNGSDITVTGNSYTLTYFGTEAEPGVYEFTPVFEKLPELSGTKCFLMNGDNYIGYASGAFTLSTTNKQEWAFGTTSDFVTPFSTLVNNQINYLGYKHTSDTDALSLLADDNNTIYFFDTATNKAATSLEVGKSYYIVVSSTSGTSNKSKYLIRVSGSKLVASKQSSSSKSDDFTLSSLNIDGSVTINVSNSVKAASTFTLASTAPVVSSVKYGKVSLAASVSNGTYRITSGTTDGSLIASEACSGAATMDVVLTAEASTNYIFKGWSVNGGTTILEGSNVASYTYSFSFDSEEEDAPTEVTLTPVFIEKGTLTGDKYYITTVDSKYLSTGTDATPVLKVGESQQVWSLDVQSENLQIQTIHKDEAYNLNGTNTNVSFTKSDNYNISLYAFDGDHSREITKVADLNTIDTNKTYAIIISTQEKSYLLNTEGTPSFVEISSSSSSSNYPKWGNTHESIKLKDGGSGAVPTKYDIHFIKVQAPSVKYGKVSLAASVSNGTYRITSGTTDGSLITSEACIGAASQDVVLAAEASANYIFKGWSVDGGTTILEGSNVASYAYSFSFDSEEEDAPTEVTLTPVFEKLPELSGTKCFLMNGDNYIGYAGGAFTSSTTDKQEWAFGTTSDFITPFSTLVNNQINYLGYPASVGSGTTVFADVSSSDNNSLCFFDTETNKPASSLETGKSYYIVVKSTRSESTSRYVVSYDGGTLKTTKASTSSGDYIISNTTISSDVTLTLDSSVKAACTFTLASTTPEPQPTTATYYGKLSVVGCSNGTVFASESAEAESGAAELAVDETVDLPAENATKTIYLYATPAQDYELLGWSTSESADDIIENSNVAKYAYTFTFGGTQAEPTANTLYAIFQEVQPTTATYYGKLSVVGSNGEVFASESAEAESGTSELAVDETVDLPAENATKTIYLYATPAKDYELLGWSTSESADDIIENSNIDKYAYTFTFGGTQAEPTAKTLYAIFQEVQPEELVPTTDVSGSDYALYLKDTNTHAGASLSLPLQMKNATEDITGLQFDLYLPKGVVWASDGTKYVQPTFDETRAEEYSSTSSCTIALNGDGSYRVLILSLNKETMSGTDGTILNIPVAVSEGMEAGDYNIFVKGIVMTGKNSDQKTTLDVTASRLTVESYLLGDANGDRTVNVTDAVVTISYIMSDNPSPFNFNAANVYPDNEINITDVVGIIDIIISEGASKQAKAKRTHDMNDAQAASATLEIAPFTISRGTTSKTASLNLVNPNDRITAFGCKVVLPAGMDWESYVDQSGNIAYRQPVFNAEANRTNASYHTIWSVRKMNDGGFYLLVFSNQKDVFFGSEGTLLDLPLVFDKNLASGNYDINISDIVLVTPDVESIKPDGSTTTVTVGSSDATTINSVADDNSNADFYNMAGVRVHKKTSGIVAKNRIKYFNK